MPISWKDNFHPVEGQVPVNGGKLTVLRRERYREGAFNL